MTFLADRDACIYVAGHRGLVGSAIWRELQEQGYRNLVGWSSQDLDLRDADATMSAVAETRPDVVIMAAARVGGILANSQEPVDFLNDNLLIQTNVFAAAHTTEVQRLLFLGSSCIYPKFAPQPIPEAALLTGPLEPTNQAYAIAKIAGIIAVRSYRQQYGRHWISAMPTNLYGPGDNFDLHSAHVLPSLIRRFDEATLTSTDEVVLWGSGQPRREFLHTDDLARAVVFLLRNYDGDQHVNIGTGSDVTIADLAARIARVVGYDGTISWDTSRPDGTPRKLLDVTKLAQLGWTALVELDEGIESVYQWFRGNRSALRL